MEDLIRNMEDIQSTISSINKLRYDTDQALEDLEYQILIISNHIRQNNNISEELKNKNIEIETLKLEVKKWESKFIEAVLKRGCNKKCQT